LLYFIIKLFFLGGNAFFQNQTRSKFGKFLDRNSITQQDLSKHSGVNRNSISRLTQSDDNRPSMKNAQKIIKALKKVGYKVDYDDFWSM
jgi:transcriptional regulator with XRE-family HTH domain